MPRKVQTVGKKKYLLLVGLRLRMRALLYSMQRQCPYDCHAGCLICYIKYCTMYAYNIDYTKYSFQ